MAESLTKLRFKRAIESIILHAQSNNMPIIKATNDLVDFLSPIVFPQSGDSSMESVMRRSDLRHDEESCAYYDGYADALRDIEQCALDKSVIQSNIKPVERFHNGY